MKAIHDEPQYTLRVYEDDRVLNAQPLFDPFVTTTIVFHLGRWDALKAFFRPLQKRWVVHVDGSREASHVVFGGDYAELPPLQPSDAVGYYRVN
jgi:hypothetical protein